MSEIEIAFSVLDGHRRAIKIESEQFQIQLDKIDSKIDEMIEPLMEERKTIAIEIDAIAQKHNTKIELITSEIKNAVLIREKSCSTEFGTCTHVKGRKGAVKWDDAALMGYVSASSDNETILQFRSEKPDGKPSTRFTLVDIE